MRTMRGHARSPPQWVGVMALSQVDLDRLDQAIASNSLEVQFGERRVRYRSIDELLSARAHVAAQIAAAAQSSGRATSRYTFTTFRGD